MFTPSITKAISQATPKINPDIANGLVVQHLNYVETYIDALFRSAASGFPPGLIYHGCRRCTPMQEYNEAVKKKGNKAVFDVAKSDVYMMEYTFTYKDEVLPNGSKYIKKYMYLPYVTDAGAIHLGGSRFIISPVLADKVISVGLNTIFVRLLKAKLNFNRTPYSYNVFSSEELKRESVQICYSEIYNKKNNTSRSALKAEATMLHYLLCKYGFTTTFKRFANCNAVVGTTKTITPDIYPDDNWVLCKSTEIKPKGYPRKFYSPSNIVVAIPRNEYTTIVKNYIASFFYITDHFPDRVIPEYIDNTRLWMTLLGLLIWSDTISEGKLYSDISDHISSLDEYLDLLVKDKLKEIGHSCENLYELFALVMNNFDKWVLTSEDRVNTMYDKELSVLYYVCYDYIESIFRAYFKLKAASKKEGLNIKQIDKILSTHITPGIVYRLTREHGEITTTTTPCDNKFFKITCLLVPQSSGGRAKKKKDRVAISDPAKRLHASVAEVGAVAAIPKSEASGRSRISPFLSISPTGLVLRNERFRKLLDDIQEKIRR